ncbi:MAG TPA: molybdopterin-synthase adenylyltransferase MoeB [Gammaproteobacteria bacterium]|nr:molybdopterin-synthase adenylyltransferase MoeB [Gammaproteobacteria bacterium]
MNIHFSPQELAYYSRQMNLQAIGQAGQHKLKQAHVLCIGAGGLGSAALIYLAAAGIGTIGIVDDDKVEISNLHRQILYSYQDIDCKKITIAQEKLQQINPAIQVITHHTFLTSTNVLSLIEPYDVMIDGSDNFLTRYLVNDACFHLKKPYVYASVSQFSGQCSVFIPGAGPCFRCLFELPPPAHLIPNCAEGGVFGVLPGIMGSIQATEAIKLILNIGQSLVGRLLILNALEMRFNELNITPNPSCQLCQYHQTFDSLSYHDLQIDGVCSSEITVNELQQLKQQNADFILLDVREPFEYEICNLQGKLIPLNELPHRLSELNRNQITIIYCKYGERSKRAVNLLMAHHFVDVRSLNGGMMAWIEQMEPTLQRY